MLWVLKKYFNENNPLRCPFHPFKNILSRKTKIHLSDKEKFKRVYFIKITASSWSINKIKKFFDQ